MCDRAADRLRLRRLGLLPRGAARAARDRRARRDDVSAARARGAIREVTRRVRIVFLDARPMNNGRPSDLRPRGLSKRLLRTLDTDAAWKTPFPPVGHVAEDTKMIPVEVSRS